MNKNKWSDRDYQRIVDAQSKDENLVVMFADESCIELPLRQLMVPDDQIPLIKAVDFTSYEVSISTSVEKHEIPWTTIRLLSDRDFATYWALQAEQQAKQVGAQLKELRLRRNLSGKEVAERAGITPQSLSRIEQGHHDVVYTTLQRILAGMGCTLQELVNVQLHPQSVASILKNLETYGVRKELLFDRILPRSLVGALTSVEPGDSVVFQVAECVSRVFGWSPEKILQPEPLIIDNKIAASARFKTAKQKDTIQATAYTVYAHFLSLLVLDTTKHIKSQVLPISADEVRIQVEERYRFVSFESLVRYVWDLGIPVIPLQDSGSFHGACWKVNDRSVIVLKQKTSHQARWLFDLAHELAHVLFHLSQEPHMLIESEEISPMIDTGEELEANKFSDNLLLMGRSQDLADICVAVAKGKVEYLKSAVIQTSRTENVPVDVLSNYMAYRLFKSNGINWWGTASNLQVTEPSPLQIARSVLREKMDLDQLSALDKDFVMRALE
jgi:transcriptional regulator with XRE-family HTH domain